MSEEEGTELLEILREVQLERFFVRIRDELQITRLSHFENNYVKTEDLESIGIGKPAARRLLEAVKKKRNDIRKKNLVNKLIPSSSGQKSSSKHNNGHKHQSHSHHVDVTCLIQEKDLELGSKIGDGSFGYVRKGFWTTSSRQKIPVALKVLKQDALNHPSVLQDFIKEVQSMHRLNHPNLIKLHGIVMNPLMMVTELAEMGSLLDHMRKQSNQISIKDIWDWAIQITSGMAFLEEERFIHRDLACRNVLLASKNKVKIGDFGLMRALPQENDCYVMTERQKVPFPWLPPESLKAKQFSHASDSWMFGVVLWELFTFGEEPWLDMNGSEILQKIDREGERLAQPLACPNLLYRTMNQCWDKDPANRPTFLALRAFLTEQFPLELVSTIDFPEEGVPDNEDFLKLKEGDRIVIIEGKTENYYWKGQSSKTFQIGRFPRNITTPLRKRATDDISQPLRNSFIHTGHGDIDSQKSWGSPAFIDEIILKNPMEAPDLLGIDEDDGSIPFKLQDRSNKRLAANALPNTIKIIQKTQQQQQQYSYSKLNNQKESLNEIDWSRIPKNNVGALSGGGGSAEGTLIDLNHETPNLYANVGTLLELDMPISPMSGEPTHSHIIKHPPGVFQPPPIPPPTYLKEPPKTTALYQSQDNQPDIFMPQANGRSSNYTARSIYSAGSFIDSECWDDAEENDSESHSPDPFDTSNILTPPAAPPLSRYYSFVPPISPEHHSEDSPNPGQSGPIPSALNLNNSLFNTSNSSSGFGGSINTPRSNYSSTDVFTFKPNQLSPIKKPNDLQSNPGLVPALSSPILSPQPVTATAAAPQPPPAQIKPSIEVLKKRDVAFSWLDNTMESLSLGVAGKSKNGSKSSLTNLSGRQSAEPRTEFGNPPMMRSSSQASGVLDSGDESWNAWAQFPPETPTLNNTEGNRGKTFALPPPPAIVRNNLSTSSLGKVGNLGNLVQVLPNQALGPIQGNSLVLAPPSYRSPPPPSAFAGVKKFEPQNSQIQPRSNFNTPYQYGSLPHTSTNMNASTSSGTNTTNNQQRKVNELEKSINDAIAKLKQAVPTASREEIIDGLKKCSGDSSKTEKLLKVEELFKLGLGPRGSCEAVLSRTNWNTEAAASLLIQ